MPRPFSVRRAAEKAAANTVSGAVPVVIYVRHGTGDGLQSIAAQQEKVLAFLATHPTYSQLRPGTGGATRPRFLARLTTRRGTRRRFRQE
ncbi:hypothetical protein [Frankia sp. Cas4]|uniref:hypothetical protein n=1 Tax=Frankia sp. Cas4 TaxID=3073927 RepID=UPI002AD3D324|nr:hypothetical protein [Frankia sp. Cas4]